MNDTTTLAAALAAPDLSTFVERAWDAHAEHPDLVAAALRARVGSLVPSEASEDAIVLGEHVWLSHLADRDGFAVFLNALPAAMADAPATSGVVRRGRWLLAALDERPAPAIPQGDRWRALQSLWSVWVVRGCAAKALAMLRHEVPAALAHPEASARRGLAATCNNLAVELRLGERGDATRHALMLALAQASRELWGTAGTWVHVERAHYQLARCHAVLGEGERALTHAKACKDTIDAHGDEPQADACERFFAHEALAWAYRVLGDRAAAAEERDRMATLVAHVADTALRSWCDDAARVFDAAVGAKPVSDETR